MHYIDVNDYFAEGVKKFNSAQDGTSGERDIADAERIFNEILNVNPGATGVLCMLGSIQATRGHHALAISILGQVVQADPKNFDAWNNMGIAWKCLNKNDQANHCFRKAAKLCPDTSKAATYSNIAASSLNCGRAADAKEWGAKAIEADPAFPKGYWHHGMACLELREWREGWIGHEYRLRGGSSQSQEIACRNYHKTGVTPWWDGDVAEFKSANGRPPLIAVHGEEGIGDEIMFASCLPDLIAMGADVVVEPHPRLGNLFKRSFPKAHVFGTHKTDGSEWIKDLGIPDFKIALGSLPLFFRNSDAEFPGKPYLVPDPEMVAICRQKLGFLAKGKPNIGITWQGGIETTRFDARSFHPSLYKPLFGTIDANWISLQYDQTAEACAKRAEEDTGVKLHHWHDWVGMKANVDRTASLISTLDLVITVCQTAVHISGALGVPTLVLTPSQPNWRYGNVKAETMPWYSSVRLLRQEPGTMDWAPVIDRAAVEAGNMLKIIKVAAR